MRGRRSGSSGRSRSPDAVRPRASRPRSRPSARVAIPMSSRYARASPPHRPVVQPLERAEAVHELALEEHVVGDGEARDQGEILVDGVDAERPRVVDRAQLHLLAVDEDLAAVGLLEAGEDLDQRRLAGAVVADQPEHLALGPGAARRRGARRPGRSASRRARRAARPASRRAASLTAASRDSGGGRPGRSAIIEARIARPMIRSK